MPILEAIVNGVSYVLTDGAPFALIEHDGGMGSVRRITDRGPAQHGDSDIDFRLEPYTFPLGLMAYAADIATHYDVRDQALRLFRPARAPIQLRWTLENGAVRQIDVHVEGQMVFRSSDARGFTQRFVVPLRAANPTLYDPTLQSFIYGVGGGGGAFTVPMAVPTGVGAATVDQTRPITQAGTWRDEPIILVVGPINDLVITNETTGGTLDFTGYNITVSGGLTIDCRAGRKSVIDETGASQIDKLSDDSDLATFAIEASPEAPGGVNSIRVTGSGATSATEIYVQFYHRYTGF